MPHCRSVWGPIYGHTDVLSKVWYIVFKLSQNWTNDSMLLSLVTFENPYNLLLEILCKHYEVRDLFPWEMLTKTAISCFLTVEKILNSAQINLSSTLNFLLKIFCRHNNIHREIDQWNRRRFGAKWHVTVPNSVTPIKPIVCKLIHMSQGWYCQMTHKLHVYEIFMSIFIKLWFREIFLKFMTKNAVFCRLVQQELNVSYETSIFRLMFMLHKYW